MAMTVMNNGVSSMAMGELNKNNSQMAKALKKVTSGMRINSAGDDASGYAISESMQVRIRGLAKCSENTDVGGNMLKVAAGAVEQQLEIMKKLRENALKASDDAYTQKDRDALQVESNQLMMQCNNISWETDYNGIRLLDGVTETFEKVVENIWVPDSGSNSNGNTPADMSQGQSSILTASANLSRDVSRGVSTIKGSGANGLLGAGNGTVDLDPTEPPVQNQIQGLFPQNNSVKKWWVTGTGWVDLPGYTSYKDIEKVEWQGTMTTRPIVYEQGSPSRFDPPLYTYDALNDNYIESTYGGTGEPYFNSSYQYYVKNGRGEAIPVEIKKKEGDLYAISMDGRDIGYNARAWSVDINFAAANLNGNALDLPKDLNNQSITILCGACSQYVGIKFETNRPAGTGQLYTPSRETLDRIGRDAYVIEI